MKTSKDGSDWELGFYRDHRGRSPVEEFINSLPLQDQAKIDTAFRVLKRFGLDLGMPHARPLRNHIWEWRPGGIRLLYFAFINRKFVFLHIFKKTTERTPNREINTAIRRMNELIGEK